jgi:predicted dienelactone hydrolase
VHEVTSVSFEARDNTRGLTFPCEVWRPAEASGPSGPCPLIVYSHYSGGHRRAATFLTTHLASHGYVVASLDHAEVVDPALQPAPDETTEDRERRAQLWIANRVPDVKFLLDVMLAGDAAGIAVDPDLVGIVGHSFGGWTALAAAAQDARIGAVVAHAPGGGRPARTGIIPVTAPYATGSHGAPTLVIAGDHDVAVPLETVRDLVDQCPWPVRLLVLRNADHLHFVDDIATAHEGFRALPAEGDYAWIDEMLPIEALCPPDEAHTYVCKETLAHFDKTLRGHELLLQTE